MRASELQRLLGARQVWSAEAKAWRGKPDILTTELWSGCTPQGCGFCTLRPQTPAAHPPQHRCCAGRCCRSLSPVRRQVPPPELPSPPVPATRPHNPTGDMLDLCRFSTTVYQSTADLVALKCTHLLSHSPHGSGVWKRLRWILSSRAHNAAVNTWASAAVTSKTRSSFPSSCGCWQSSVPHGYTTKVPAFLLAGSWAPLSSLTLCPFTGPPLTTRQLTSSKPPKEHL